MSITSNNQRTALSLSSVSSVDVGSYQCRLSNAHGQATSRAASLVLASECVCFTGLPLYMVVYVRRYVGESSTNSDWVQCSVAGDLKVYAVYCSNTAC